MSDQLIIPPSVPEIDPKDPPMDEFEIKPTIGLAQKTPATKDNHEIKHTKIKLYLALAIVVIVLLATTLIVKIAISKPTGNSTPIAVATPLPTVVFNTPSPTIRKELPPDWQSLQDDLQLHKESLTKPNDDRSKLSIPSINFDTSLNE